MTKITKAVIPAAGLGTRFLTAIKACPMTSRYKILDRLVPTTLGACWYWSEFYLYNYFVLQGVEQVFSWGKDRIDDSQLPVFTDSLYHTIKANDKYIVVQFK